MEIIWIQHNNTHNIIKSMIWVKVLINENPYIGNIPTRKIITDILEGKRYFVRNKKDFFQQFPVIVDKQEWGETIYTNPWNYKLYISNLETKEKVDLEKYFS